MASKPQDRSDGHYTIAKADKDIIGLGVVVAMIVLIIATGSSALADAVTALISHGQPRNQMQPCCSTSRC
jgi:hypothetical protein